MARDGRRAAGWHHRHPPSMASVFLWFREVKQYRPRDGVYYAPVERLITSLVSVTSPGAAMRPEWTKQTERRHISCAMSPCC